MKKYLPVVIVLAIIVLDISGPPFANAAMIGCQAGQAIQGIDLTTRRLICADLPAASGRSARQVRTPDTRPGCPPTAPAVSPLIEQILTLENASIVSLNVDMVRFFAGRADLSLFVNNAEVTRTLTFTPSSQWDAGHIAWVGELGAGTHTISVRSDNTADAWGCGSLWGAINTLILE